MWSFGQAYVEVVVLAMVIFTIILSWVDAHTNLPIRARWFAKADEASLLKQPSEYRQPSPCRGLFYCSQSVSKRGLLNDRGDLIQLARPRQSVKRG